MTATLTMRAQIRYAPVGYFHTLRCATVPEVVVIGTSFNEALRRAERIFRRDPLTIPYFPPAPQAA